MQTDDGTGVPAEPSARSAGVPMRAAGPDRQAVSAVAAWASITRNSTLTPMPRATNPLWLVDTGEGPSLVLKQLPEHPVGVTPLVEFRVLSHLQGSGVPVALPIPTDAGTLLADAGRRHWTLLPFLPHQRTNHELGPNGADTAFAVGAALGRLDRALAEYPWPVASYVDDPTQVLTEALPQLPPEAIRLVEPVSGRLAAACTDLPVQLTHGDCNDGNVLLAGGRVTGIVDVDHLPSGPRVRDLAYYLASRVARHLRAPTAERDTSALLSVLSRYVAGYDDSYPLTRREREAIVSLMVLIELAGAHWSLHGWHPDVESYRRSIGSVSWLVRRYDDLAHATTAR